LDARAVSILTASRALFTCVAVEWHGAVGA
jgi:hypothetical protein